MAFSENDMLAFDVLHTWNCKTIVKTCFIYCLFCYWDNKLQSIFIFYSRTQVENTLHALVGDKDSLSLLYALNCKLYSWILLHLKYFHEDGIEIVYCLSFDVLTSWQPVTFLNVFMKSKPNFEDVQSLNMRIFTSVKNGGTSVKNGGRGGFDL